MALRSEILTAPEAMRLLAPFQETLMKIVWRAWMDRRDRWTIDPMLADGNALMSAVFMQNRMVAHAREMLEPLCRQNFELDVSGQTVHFRLLNNIRVRFKKQNPAGMTSNILTGQERLFREHEQLTLDLTAVDGKHALLAVGYCLDETGYDISDVAISCIDPENTSEVLWHTSILDDQWIQEVENDYVPEPVYGTQASYQPAAPTIVPNQPAQQPAASTRTASGVVLSMTDYTGEELDAGEEMQHNPQQGAQIETREQALAQHESTTNISLPSGETSSQATEQEDAKENEGD